MMGCPAGMDTKHSGAKNGAKTLLALLGWPWHAKQAVQGTRKAGQQWACVLQHGVVRDEGKGLALVGCEEKEERGRQSSPCLLGPSPLPTRSECS